MRTQRRPESPRLIRRRRGSVKRRTQVSVGLGQRAVSPSPFAFPLFYFLFPPLFLLRLLGRRGLCVDSTGNNTWLHVREGRNLVVLREGEYLPITGRPLPCKKTPHRPEDQRRPGATKGQRLGVLTHVRPGAQ